MALFLNILIVLIVIGLVIWLVTTYIPLDPAIKKIIQVAGILIALFYLLNALGLTTHLPPR